MNGASKVGTGQDPMLDLVNTRDYTVVYNDSPSAIAKRFGITLSDLLAANPQKPTTVTAGVRTFREIRVGETLNIPTVGLSGADATGVGFNFFKAALLPWGAITETEKALRHSPHRVTQGARFLPQHTRSDQTWERWRQVHPGTPYSDYIQWYEQYGKSGGTIGDAGTGVGDVVSDTMNALSQVDPCNQTYVGMVCSAQSVLGLNPDGKWGSQSYGAAKARGLSAPSPCSPRPSWWAPVGQSNCGSVSAPPPVPIYGNAPVPMPAPMPMPGPAPAPIPMPVPGPGGAPGGGGGPGGPGGSASVVVQPGGGVGPVAKHGISTGMIVAGAIGVAALVGIVAIAATSGKKTQTRYRKGKTKIKYRLRRAPKHYKRPHKKR